MKRLIPALLAAVILTTGVAKAQTNAPKTGHRIGLIDMAHVFQEYEKFKSLRDSMKVEIERSDAELKLKAERFQKLQTELKKHQIGSPSYEQFEKQILEQKGDIEAFRAATTRKLARRESEMFKTIYNDVTAAVKLYAEYAKYDAVMRYNRKSIEETANPQEAVTTMNKTFIYTKKENDITDTVLDYLNKQYGKSGGTPARAAGSSQPVRN